MATYTYTIFDANPNSSSGTAWPSHEDVEIEADSDQEAIDDVRDVMSVEAAGLNAGDGYDVGQRLYAIVWDADEVIVGEPTYELTAEDLGVIKSGVVTWETVASYVQTYPSDGEDGACDVEVQIGEAAGVWFLRTRDDAGGSDEADDTTYTTEAEAREAAEQYADDAHVGQRGEDAADYLRRQTEARVGEPDAKRRVLRDRARRLRSARALRDARAGRCCCESRERIAPPSEVAFVLGLVLGPILLGGVLSLVQWWDQRGK